ncbi:kelch-like protein diablo [Halichondria panicea]|uniref:kelch-like protein diablo n=1 Tax=Halichondria panicea TaxID=6063 RepID=UPI00312B9ED1
MGKPSDTQDTAMEVAGTASPFTFTAPTHASCILTAMNDCRDRNELCDVILYTEECELSAHRIVLACCSPYFSAMFSNKHRESKQDRIKLIGIDSQSLTDLVAYAYTSTLVINESNVQNVLAGAGLLQITPVIEACCEFLQSLLDHENCLGIASFAEMHGCLKLYESSWSFVLENFSDVAKTEEFLSIPHEYLIELVKSGNLSVQSEESVLDCVLKWFNHNRVERLAGLATILKHVRLPLIASDVLKDKILGDPHLSCSPDCLALVANANRCSPDIDGGAPDSPEHVQFIPRKSIGQSTVLYVIGGERAPGRLNVDVVERFSPSKNAWTELCPMSTSRRGMGVASMDGYVYVIGGSDGLNSLRLVERYDPVSNNWTKLADLHQERSSVSAAVLDGKLYAIGGYDGSTSCLDSVERYDPIGNSWTYVANMSHQRSMSAVGVLNGFLYVVGGYNGAADLSTCEVYNPITNQWTDIPPMKACRCMSGVGVLDNKVYAIGGCDCSKSLNSIEIYDPQKQAWELGPDMSDRRSGLGVAVVGSKLYAVGGYTGDEYLSSMECYDPKVGGWSLVAPLGCGKRRFGCCS